MINENSESEHLENYAEVVLLLEKNLRYIEALGMDETTMLAYRKVISYLRSRPSEEIRKILGGKAIAERPPRFSDPDLTDEEIGKLKGEQIRRHLAAAKVSRRFLERIASLRFGVTKGTLSTLRSRDALTEKLYLLLDHEGTHEVISRAARAEPGNDSSTTS